MQSKLDDGQCGFCPGHSTTNQIFIFRQIFEKSWEFAKDAFACFVDQEKTYDRVRRDKLWRVLQENSIDEHLLMTIIYLFIYFFDNARLLSKTALTKTRKY